MSRINNPPSQTQSVLDGRYVKKAGDTMTGALVVGGNLGVSAGYTYDLGAAGTPWNNGWFGFSVNIQNSGINTEIVAGANGSNQILTLPLNTDTIVARNSTDTLTNKTLTAPIINGIIKPSSDSTTAIQIDKADGATNVANFDTTNARLGIGTTAPSEILHLNKTTGNFTTMRFDSGTCQGYFFSYDGTPEVSLGSLSNAPVNMKVNNATKATFNTSGNFDLVGKASTYNNIATAGWGHPAIYGQGRSTAQTAAVSSVAAYTVGGSDGSFLISANANITAFVAGTFNVTVSYTDETNTAQTLKLNFSSLTGTIGIALAASGPFEGIPAHIRCKAGTTITIATSGTFTSLTYNVEGVIQQIA